MQRLLSGKTRLPGFSKPWETMALGDVLKYEQPTKYLVADTNYDDSYETPVLTAGKTFLLGYTNEKEGVYSKNLPVIIFDDFTTASQLVGFPFKAKSSAMKILSTVNTHDSIEVIFAAINLIEFVTKDHKRHWISVFQHHEIDLPEPDEQQAIAEVLGMADREIEALERKLEKWREQKKYLLNNLVTGTVRLPQFKE